MILFITQYWRAILVAVLLVGSNYLTYQYVDNKWELKWQEANVEALKSTLEQQKLELDKQKQTIKSLQEVNNNAKQRTDKINSDLIAANKSLELFKQTISRLSKGGKGTYTGTVDRSSAANATTELIYGQLLERCATRVIGLAEITDRHRAAGLACQEQYNKIREVINGK
jgi:chromosome segregation ATPase